jgi:hypothetical protein
MPRKRKAMSKLPKDEQIIPLPGARRPWYYTPLRVAAYGLVGFSRIFKRRQKWIVDSPPRGARRHRKN